MKNNNLQVIAYMHICGSLSLEIYGIEYGIDDKVVVGYSNEKPTKNKLYCNSKGETYFKKHGKRFYINEFMRVNY